MGPGGGRGSDPSPALPGPESPVKAAVPECTMARWALLVLLVLMLGRALLVPATPIPALQHLPRSCPQATPGLVAPESPSASSTGPLAARGPSQLGSRITLSLDVPIGLLQILLEQAQARASREQASANARIMARVGRR